MYVMNKQETNERRWMADMSDGAVLHPVQCSDVKDSAVLFNAVSSEIKGDKR
jgi:hypothetical protein